MALENSWPAITSRKQPCCSTPATMPTSGLFAALANRHTTVLYDEYCHASILDGIRLSHAKRLSGFKHNNLADLQQKLEQHAGDGPLIIALESVYSMEAAWPLLPPLRL